ncbi:MAG: hypothetical protein KA354_03380 [Phycisphaerae bacterium]|nr:hypothetical protein [Phycisphaerae bacterium]
MARTLADRWDGGVPEGCRRADAGAGLFVENKDTDREDRRTECAMAIDIRPGQWINVTVTRQPRAAGAMKTLARLLQMDKVARKKAARARKARPVGEHRRGGRMWKDRPSRVPAVSTDPGATYRIFASLDVLKDLTSIKKYVQIAPA